MDSPFTDFVETENAYEEEGIAPDNFEEAEMFADDELSAEYFTNEAEGKNYAASIHSSNETEGEEMEEEEDEEELGELALEESETIASGGVAEPIQLPKSNPVPFARLPLPGSYWPIVTSHSKGREVAYQTKHEKMIGNPSRRFMASRSNGKRFHAAVDLWGNHKDPVVACEDGKIVNFYHFYHGAWALLVEHNDIVINYGEVDRDSLKIAGLKINDTVKAGQQIGIVGKMYKSSMLHLETYVKGTKKNQRFMAGKARPSGMLNPTRYLLSLKESGHLGNTSISPSPTPARSDWSKAIERNQYYSKQLGWDQYYDRINDLLLPFSGLQHVSLGEEAFAQALALWQRKHGFSEKDSDGILGPKTWEAMRSAVATENRGQSVVNSSGNVPDSSSAYDLGKLKVDTSIPALSKSYPEYQFTLDDTVWLARFVEGEAGGKDNPDSHAVIWAMFNRFGTVRHRVPSWTSFSVFLQKYSTTLQPLLNSKAAAERVWDNYRRDPKKYPIVEGTDYYPGSNVKRVQYLKHKKLQEKKWSEFPSYVRTMVSGILTGKIPNPGIGIATHFLSSYVLLKAKRRKEGITSEPTTEEWRAYTLQIAQNKKLIWIGDSPKLNQRKNAFFIQPEFKHVPFDAIKVSPSGADHETTDYEFMNEIDYHEAVEEEFGD